MRKPRQSLAKMTILLESVRCCRGTPTVEEKIYFQRDLGARRCPTSNQQHGIPKIACRGVWAATGLVMSIGRRSPVTIFAKGAARLRSGRRKPAANTQRLLPDRRRISSFATAVTGTLTDKRQSRILSIPKVPGLPSIVETGHGGRRQTRRQRSRGRSNTHFFCSLSRSLGRIFSSSLSPATSFRVSFHISRNRTRRGERGKGSRQDQSKKYTPCA